MSMHSRFWLLPSSVSVLFVACQAEPGQVARDLVTNEAARRELRSGLAIESIEGEAAKAGEKLKQLESQAATKSDTGALARQLESRPTQDAVNLTARNAAQDEVGRFDANVRSHAVEVFREQYQALLKRVAEAESGLADMQRSYSKEIENRGQLLDGMAQHLSTQVAGAVETGKRLGAQLREFEQLMNGLASAYEGLGLQCKQENEIREQIAALEYSFLNAATAEIRVRVEGVEASFKGVSLDEAEKDRKRRLDGVQRSLMCNLERSLDMVKAARPQLQNIKAAYEALNTEHEKAGTSIATKDKQAFEAKIAELRQVLGETSAKMD